MIKKLFAKQILVPVFVLVKFTEATSKALYYIYFSTFLLLENRLLSIFILMSIFQSSL